ncbi:MAG: Hsp70 family protein [Candidatus Gastranaerophilales bacterium]|nr:Hsp70 family protein [Candidatus Gastranaerophilales bacterium]
MVLGIDLGTTYSAAAYLDENGEPQIVTNAEGHKATPSVVMIDKNKVVVGEAAKKRAFQWFGKVFSRMKMQMGIKGFFRSRETDTEYRPEELSAYILKKLTQDAGQKLQEQITGVVVTFPANFQDNQRKATQDAICAAGLTEVGMINEPTAAALYFCHKTHIDRGTILIYDLGGGTFDATLMTVNGNEIEVLATVGDNTVGGVYFDDEIVKYVIEKFRDRYQVDLEEKQYDSVRNEIALEAEDCKKTLSECEQAYIYVNLDGERKEVVITREEFERLIQPVYKGTESTIKMMMRRKGFKPEKIDRVFITGGSSRIPYVKKQLERLFKRELFYDEDTDNAVALGAALYGRLCTQTVGARELSFQDVCSHGVGVLLYEGDEQYNEVLIEPNSKIPATVEYRCQTRFQGQSRISLTVTQGESRELAYVNPLSVIDIKLPGRFPAGTLVNIGIALDEKQMLHVYVDIPDANIKEEYHLKRLSNLSEEEVHDLSERVADAELLFGAAKPEKSKIGFFDKLKKTKRADRIVKESVNDYFRGVVGMKKIKEDISILYTSHEMGKKGIGGKVFQWNFLIGGEKGSGKKMLAGILAEILYDLHYTDKREPIEISAVQLLGDPDNLNLLLNEDGKKCTMLIQDTEKLINSSEQENKRDNDNIWTLIDAYLDDAVRSRNVFYIFTGEKDAMETIREKYPQLTAEYMTYLEIPTYTMDELFQIGKGIIEKDGYRVAPEAEMKLFRLIKNESVRGNFANIHSLQNIWKDIYMNVVARYSQNPGMERVLREEDFILTDSEEETVEELLDKLQRLPGLRKVKEEVARKVTYFQYCEKLRREGETPDDEITLHTLLLGPPGTGKTTVARLIGKIYGSLGILPRSDIFHEVTRADLVAEYAGQTAPKVEKAVKEALGGVLFLDEAYDLVHSQNGGNDSFGEEALTTLMKYAWDYRDRFMIIMTGYEKEMNEFINVNQGMDRRFPRDNRLHFEDYSDDELYEIFLYMIKEGGYALDEDAVEPVKQLIRRRRSLKGYENAGGVRNTYEGLKQAVAFRIVEAEAYEKDKMRTIKREDIDRYMDNSADQDKTLEDYLDELNALTGLQGVKKAVEEKINFLKLQKRRREEGIDKGGAITLHTMFLGAPGTGKTTVARLLGKIYGKMDLLADGNLFIEVKRSDLVSTIVGGTEKNMEDAVDRAMGGVLFIDEAHKLVTGEQDEYGKAALATLIPLIENHRDNLMVIMAGYEDGIRELKKYDSGLDGRFPNQLLFEDYTEEELYRIFLYILKKNQFFLDEDAKDAVMELIRRKMRGRDFGNAREMRNLYEKLYVAASERIAAMERKADIRELQQITRTDVESLTDNTDAKQEKTVEDYLAELDAMVGLGSVKKKVKEMLVNFRVARKMSKDRGEAVSAGSLHMIFEGNAGTGKTTVARLIGKILALEGVLPNGDVFVEVNRNKLVAGYQGQTAIKTAELVEQAMGGVLFIDEAYALVAGEQDSFGKEALDTLIAPIENNRDDLMVIMAGYPDQMEELMSRNAGLRSRMRTVVYFEDYTLDEMYQIFCGMVEKRKYRLETGLETVVREYICRERDKAREDGGDFGNARGVRNCVEDVISRHNLRVSEGKDLETLSDEEFYTISKADIAGEE